MVPLLYTRAKFDGGCARVIVTRATKKIEATNSIVHPQALGSQNRDMLVCDSKSAAKKEGVSGQLLVLAERDVMTFLRRPVSHGPIRTPLSTQWLNPMLSMLQLETVDGRGRPDSNGLRMRPDPKPVDVTQLQE